MEYRSPFVITNIIYLGDSRVTLYGSDKNVYEAIVTSYNEDDDNFHLKVLNPNGGEFGMKYSVYDDKKCLLAKALVEKGLTIREFKNLINEGE